MPDKNPEGAPTDSAPESLLRHSAPPGLKRWGRLAVIAAVMIAVVGIGSRMWKGYNTAAWTDEQAVQTVQIITLKNGKGGSSLTLPGDVQAFTSAPIYAQVSGYVKKWYVDIGAPVKKGQLLAELDTPDLAGQSAQGRANLVNAIAAQKLSEATARRYDALFAQGAVARQAKDEKDADLAAKNAAVAAARASLYSVSSQENFRRLVAPFDGVVTSRSVDTGALVTVGTPASTPLFTVSDLTKLRIYVRVPQNYASYIRPGMEVSFSVPQYPGRVFHATLVASAGAVASSTGTVLVQFGMDNKDNALQPGAYAEVKFPLPAGANGIRVPATALMFRDEGMQVATVDATNHVKLKTIIISRDLGAAVDVGGGIGSKDRIIDNPADALRDGDEVKVANQ
ncbi:MAG: efflux RND transporter periplasmic adaptor subunit [Alphaproteobacteria bacterium]|nr:efflux RND transporter periplasmic adaptor subunit [Alphaproteobacteria bacterium]